MLSDEWGKRGLSYSESVASGDGGCGLAHGLTPEPGATVIHADDEWIGVIGDVFLYALAEPVERLPDEGAAYLEFLAFSRVEEDRRARNAPVNVRSHGNPWELVRAWGLGVGWLWPVQWDAIAARDEEQAFPGGGGAEV
ncbi:TPA: hypothetical protein ACNIDN_006399, partial [Pseudomonas aeruginosa]|nr:hypothetical protein [Pseudomonas aeruginosa]HBO7402314.1 hypothetical protein [Pseudomonas aeruginosa]HCF1668452.1 hypothetical protein [Pseudomonas aeruginosa]HCF5967791.1 hypothetical protein [Pseudomonas aeruginosa]HDG9209953.1 hypothetical protein [Pseudomonas aeruginosa]